MQAPAQGACQTTAQSLRGVEGAQTVAGAWVTQLWGFGGQPQSGPRVGFRLLVPEWAVTGTLQAVPGWVPVPPGLARGAQLGQGLQTSRRLNMLPVPPTAPSARSHPHWECVCVHPSVCMHAYACLCRGACVHTRMHTHMHVCVHVCTCVCVHACPCVPT